jgi:cyclohexanone monooxygenase
MSTERERLHNLFPDLDFDPAALREKYRAERDKRIRDDGENQYIEAASQFAHYADDDPYVDPGYERAPLELDIDVVVIGAGFSGLMAAARLKERGITNFRIIEAGGDFGGTWYWNRYPGAQCDIESYCYLPLLEETGYMPKEKYSYAPEIYSHTQRVGDYFGLYDNAIFQTRVTEVKWLDDAQRWQVSTHRNDNIRAQFVIQATGPANRPKLPGIPGIGEFKGHTFHTSRWDYDYTGGDHHGGLTKLADKRVAIIGTGATAIQCVPFVGEYAKKLYVFQRTPSSVDVRNNRPTDPQWATSLEPGWQKHRMTNFNVLVTGGFQEEDLVADGWTDIIRNLGGLLMRNNAAPNQTPEQMATVVELADFQKMEQVRARVDAIVSDQATAEALKPYYRQFCKRPCFHDEYLHTFNRPNVKLVDTQGRGVERITENAIVVDGKAYEVDCIIFATGFEVGTAYTRRAGYEVVGRDGVALTNKWAKGLSSYHGFLTRGFPNCFFMGITQGGFTANFPHMLNEQALHVSYIVKRAMDRQARTIEPSQAAENGWVATMESKKNANLKFLQECTPGYYNNEGKPGSGMSLLDAQYGGGPEEFFRIIRDWRDEGSMQGIEVA